MFLTKQRRRDIEDAAIRTARGALIACRLVGVDDLDEERVLGILCGDINDSRAVNDGQRIKDACLTVSIWQAEEASQQEDARRKQADAASTYF